MTFQKLTSIAFTFALRKAQSREISLKHREICSHGLADESTSRNETLTIIIPTRDKVDLLRKCIESVLLNSRQAHYEIIIVDNDSQEEATLNYLTSLSEKKGIRVLKYSGEFNFAAICNLAAFKSESEYLCFLNNDVEILASSWLENLMYHAKNPNIGFVGGVLKYPNGRLQHAGIALNLNGIATHPLRGQIMNSPAVKSLTSSCYEVEAVTFACAMVKRDVYFSLGGLSADFPVGLNDVDICLSATRTNLKNVICSKVVGRHGESKSRSKPWSIKGFRSSLRAVIQLETKWGVFQLKDRYFEHSPS